MPQRPTESLPDSSPSWAFAGEAARILGVSRDTLIKLSDEGAIPCWRPTEGAQRRYDRDALLRIRDEARGATA